MANELQGRKIAFLATDGVEQVELTEPLKAAKEAGAETHLISIKPDQIDTDGEIRLRQDGLRNLLSHACQRHREVQHQAQRRRM